MIIIIILIICMGIVLLSYISYWSKIEQQHYDCITYENYSLIKESPFSEECSRYEILRKENQIWFQRDEYCLFYIQINTENPKKVDLIGLEGYGMRNMEFKKYVCKLVQKIKIKHNSI